MPSQFRAYNAQLIAGKGKKKVKIPKPWALEILQSQILPFHFLYHKILFFTNLFRFLFWWDKESTSLWPL